MPHEYINPYRLFYGAIIPNWLMKRREISASAKQIYARLAQFAGEKGYCVPKIDTLADETGESTRNVIRGIKQLENVKLISKTRRGLNRSNRYYFLKHSWMEWIPEEVINPDVKDREPAQKTVNPGSDNLSHPEVTSCHHGSDKLSLLEVPLLSLPNVLRESFEENQYKRINNVSLDFKKLSLKQKTGALMNGYETNLVIDQDVLVSRFSDFGFEPLRVWAAILSSRGAKNPAGCFVSLLGDPKTSFSDDILQEAKSVMNSKALSAEEFADLFAGNRT